MLYLACVLLFLTGLAHSYLGERYLLMRLFKRDNLPHLFGSTVFTIGTLRFAWHLTTVAWWGMGALLYIAAAGPIGREQILTVFGITALISAAFPIYFTRGRHLSWIIFLAVGVLLLLAR
jgi:hypothetical protein